MGSRFKLFLGAAAVVAATCAVPAGACDSSACALLTRGQGGSLPKGAFRLDLSYRSTEENVRLEGHQYVDDVYIPKIAFDYDAIWPEFHRQVDGQERFLQLDLGYGLTPRLTLVASVPVDGQRAHTIAHFGYTQRYDTNGFGDALVGARFVATGNLVAGFSVKLPTGRHRIGGDFDGSIPDPSLQPGSGSWDFVGTLQESGSLPLGLAWSAATSYTATTANDLGYRFGNQAILTGNLSRPVAGRVSASFQTKLFHQARSDYVGRDVPSTGSTIVYVTPGLHVDVPGNVSLYGFLQLPAYSYVNDMQVGPRVAFLAGISKLF